MPYVQPAMLGAIGPDYTLQWVLFAGLSVWTLLLLAIMWTRWGQARPLVKCVALSIFAHLLLVLFMWGTRVLSMLPPGESLAGTVHVRLVEDTGDENLTPWTDPTEEPADKPPENGAPPLMPAPPAEAQPAEETKPEPSESPPAEQSPQPAQQVAQDTPPPPTPELPMNLAADEAAPPPDNALRQPDNGFAQNQLREAPPAEPMPEMPRMLEDPLQPARQYVPIAQPAAAPRRAADGETVAPQLQLRMRADRFEVAKRYGATPDSERAVRAALVWLVANQHDDGRWLAAAHGAGRETRALGQDRQGAGQKADTGITGLALLAFLAAGQTHLEGEHREHIQHGLEFLLASQAENGSLSGQAELFAAMYCHGIATLALTEAYALTGDRRLHAPVQAAINYTLEAQHVNGGWRYQPHDAGDLSQFGWQLMALKSAEMGGLPIPDQTRVRMIRFLRTVSAGRYKGLASYRPGEVATRPMTAEALACRFFLDADNSPETIEEAAAFISQELPRGDRINLYYWYYGTLALFQKQDADWVRWNNALQAELLPRQRGDGQFLGSWDPDQVWGGYGGRVYSTSLACLCLEASYRYLPVYADPVGADRLTEVPGSPFSPARPR
ncbi:Pectic acid lyase [Anatilimnocola aggregata]|uniref:Pectic acid lyase n=1 Tax=Anatilimnocola aggregata TaxID=2528021 RepID=A0A517Y690_9BACT|nr:terpene cyclase/mutase family protein [Anatilimnocola aggregata]QDU25759.1 Pectic acid lyase [Anatilimnocola aggregata]